jgi:hypothetical protein
VLTLEGMRTRVASLVVLLAVLLSSRSAHADSIDVEIGRILDSDTMRLAYESARRGLQRFRRSATLGPTTTTSPAYALDTGEADLQLGIGLALLRYRIPTVPTEEELRALLLSTVKATVEAEFNARAERDEHLSEDDMKKVVADAWQQIKDRLLLELRPRRLEKPKLMLVGEIGYLLSDNAWDFRVMGGYGVGPVFLAAGAALHWDGGTNLTSKNSANLLIPLEVSVPVLLNHGLRAPVLQCFLRYDWPVTGTSNDQHRVFAGARLALDIL